MFKRKAQAAWVRRSLAVLAGTITAGAIILGQVSPANAAEDSGNPLKGNQDPNCIAYKALKDYSFHINDGKALPKQRNYKDIKDLLKQGDKVTFKFILQDKCKDVWVGLDSYYAGSREYKPELQKRYQREAGLFQPGKWNVLEVKAPDCYFQVDAYTNQDFKPGPKLGKYDKRFLTGDLGGKDANCEQPAVHKPTVEIQQVCKADASGWKIDFTNKGNVEETFVVKNGKKTLDTVKVAAGKTTTKNYSFKDAGVAAGKSIKIDVTADGKTVGSKTIVNDCTKVAAEITYCVPAANGVPATTDGAILTFKNTGKLTETFNVTRDGTVVTGSPLSVNAGQTVQRKLPLQEDEKASIVITSDRGNLRVAKDVVNDCAPPPTPPAEVLAEQVVQPQLAATGSNVTPLAVGASVLVIGGLLLFLISNRRRSSAQ